MKAQIWFCSLMFPWVPKWWLARSSCTIKPVEWAISSNIPHLPLFLRWQPCFFHFTEKMKQSEDSSRLSPPHFSADLSLTNYSFSSACFNGSTVYAGISGWFFCLHIKFVGLSLTQKLCAWNSSLSFQHFISKRLYYNSLPRKQK